MPASISTASSGGSGFYDGTTGSESGACRLCILLAAVLWTERRVHQGLTKDTVFHLNEPEIEPLVFAGLKFPSNCMLSRAVCWPRLSATVRPRDVVFAGHACMVACFTVMNALFISASPGQRGQRHPAAILRTLWMYLAAIFLLGERPDWRGVVSMFIGLLGIGVIVAGGWQQGDLIVIAIALAAASPMPRC